MNEIKIGLTGKARSGKDTVANYIVGRYDFRRVAFGDELKKAIAYIFPDLLSEKKPRALFQKFGQSMREFDEDVWIKHALKRTDFSRIVISDVRQPNEYRRLKELGYVIIRVEAPIQSRFDRMMALNDVFEERDMTDETEVALDEFDVDYTLKNDGAISDLMLQIDAVIAELQNA